MDELCCLVLQETMIEPVIAADGYTYEKVALEAWLKLKSTSPITQDSLLHTCFVQNFLIKRAINQLQRGRDLHYGTN